jgi:hypothetical protein
VQACVTLTNIYLYMLIEDISGVYYTKDAYINLMIYVEDMKWKDMGSLQLEVA